MKLLADENIPLVSVRGLRDLGHDIVSIAEQSPGISDEEVLRLSRAQGRVIVTFDRDYGELSVWPAPARAGRDTLSSFLAENST